MTILNVTVLQKPNLESANVEMGHPRFKVELSTSVGSVLAFVNYDSNLVGFKLGVTAAHLFKDAPYTSDFIRICDNAIQHAFRDWDGENCVIGVDIKNPLYLMDLAAEYNDNLVGYVVTDKTSSRSVNFQFDQRSYSTHYTLHYGCTGDDTYRAFNEDERDYIRWWLREQPQVRTLEAKFTDAMSLDRDEDGMRPLDAIMATCGCVTIADIEELAEQADS